MTQAFRNVARNVDVCGNRNAGHVNIVLAVGSHALDQIFLVDPEPDMLESGREHYTQRCAPGTTADDS